MRIHSRGLALAAGALLTLAPLVGNAGPSNPDLTPADRTFVTKAIAAGYLEVAEGLAMQRSRDPRVRMFARAMVHDHGLLNTQLAAIAKEADIPYSARLPRVAPMRDRVYMQREVADHQAAIAMYKDESTASRSTLHTIVGDALPVLEGHLAMAQAYLAGRPMVRTTPDVNQNNATGH